MTFLKVFGGAFISMLAAVGLDKLHGDTPDEPLVLGVGIITALTFGFDSVTGEIKKQRAF